MNSKTRIIIIFNLTVLGYAIGDAITRAKIHYLGVFLLSAIGGFFACVITVPFLLAKPENRKITNPYNILILGIVGVAGYLLSVFALTRLTLSQTTVITMTYEIFVPIMAVLFFKEKLTIYQWLCVLLGMIGIVLVIQPTAHPENLWAFVAALAAAFFYAVEIIYTNKVGKTESPYLISFVDNLMIFILCIVIAYFRHMAIPGFHIVIWPAILGCIIGITGIAYIYSFIQIDAEVITPYGYLSIVWAFILDAVLWHDKLDLMSVIGTFVILASIIAYARLGASPRTPQSV